MATAYREPVTPPVYDGPIFDTDTHLVEKDWSMFRRNLPEKYWADWLIEIRDDEDGPGLYVGKTRVENSEANADGLVPPPGKLKEWLKAISSGDQSISRIEKTPDMYDPAARMAKLVEFGVEGSVLFIGSFVGCFGVIGKLAVDIGAEGANAVLHAYNQWLLDEWKFNRDDRIYSTPVLSLWDLDWALKEADWLIENGARVVVMPMGPAHGKAPADPFFDPLWQKLNDAGILISFHVSEANFMHAMMEEWNEKPMQPRRVGQTAWQWMFSYSEIPVMMTMASFIYYNFFARFPKLKMVSVENGAEWLPRFLYKMDKMRGMARNGFWPMGQLTERPSAIFKKHCFVVAYPEDDIKKIIAEIGGAECLLMGSDYPHAEGVPEPRDFVAEGLVGLDDQQIADIMFHNGRRMLPNSR